MKICPKESDPGDKSELKSPLASLLPQEVSVGLEGLWVSVRMFGLCLEVREGGKH